MTSSVRMISLLAVLAGGLWLTFGGPRGENAAPPLPDQVDDLGSAGELRAALIGPHAREDGMYLAHVFTAAAERLEQDGKHAQPLMTRRIQVEAFVERLGQAAVMGRTQGRYPAMPDIVGQLFAEHFPSEQGQLSTADRESAVRVLRALAAGCRKAVDG